MSLLRQGPARLPAPEDTVPNFILSGGAAPPQKIKAGLLARALSKFRLEPKRVGLVALAGVGLGVAAATLSPGLLRHAHPPTEILPATSGASPDSATISVVPLPAPAATQPSTRAKSPAAVSGSSAEELERLRTRNRRLEALIQVLRKRSGADSQAKGEALMRARN